MTDATTLETVLAILVGIGLSAAVGLRIFAPFLVMSIAARAGLLGLASGFEWIGTTPALIAFGLATALEIVAYWIPWVDHALDVIAAPVTVIAGILATASVVTDMSPFLKWTIAVIAGGGAAGLLHGGTAIARTGSTATTGGLANPIFSTLESAGAILGAVLAILAPLIAIGFLVAVAFLVRRVFRRRSRREPALG
ncbi:MAG: DUF4126 domain-containing protein [bacterium]